MRLMGYNCVMSMKQINDRHGSVENFLKMRLCISDNEQLKAALLSLKEKEKDNAAHKIGIDNVASNGVHIDALCFSVLKALYKQYDQDKKDLIINTIASVNNIDAVDLASKLDQLLQ